MDELLNQLELAHFPFALAMGEDNVFIYGWSTLTGLIRVDMPGRRFKIIAIENTVPHNGEYIKFIEMVERLADKHRITFTVSDFMNARLRQWFIKRGYEYVREFDTVIYINRVVAQ